MIHLETRLIKGRGNGETGPLAGLSLHDDINVTIADILDN
jgi:hypothetical protein